MSSKKLIFVTGINGFLGSHIVDQLIKAGYRVRGTVRSAKVDFAKESNAIHGADVEVVAADDLAFGDFTDALKGVHGVIHAAAPLIGRDSPENALTASIEGAVNVLHQAEAAGITRFVLVSSIVTVMVTTLGDNTVSFTDKDWVDTSREKALASNDPSFVYVSEKVLAERAVWEFAEKHPNIDVTTGGLIVNPPYFIGPFAPNFRFSDALVSQQSTNALLYTLILPNGKFFAPVLLPIDVRDVARATVLALATTTGATVERKRLLLFPHTVSWKEAADTLEAARPELKNRISKHALTDYVHPAPANPVDNSKSIAVLKFGKFIDWKTSLLDGVDALIAEEKKFAKEGKTFH
ncbi:NAD-P-binding protein [Trametes gibbosa]|nr:NAD-P-binding protein [Trametes gibbosa]KAI0828278.1 NAD-P-binding protein [Trametes gibbosa]